MIQRMRCTALLSVGLLLAACGSDEMPVASETVAKGPVTIHVRGEGELRSAKPTPLIMPGKNWSARQVEWMVPEGSLVKKGDLLARFISPRSIVLDRHVPLVAFLVLSFVWLTVTALRIKHCLQIGVELCK